MNKSKNKKTIRLRDEVPADFDTQRLESDLSLLKSFDKGLERRWSNWWKLGRKGKLKINK